MIAILCAKRVSPFNLLGVFAKNGQVHSDLIDLYVAAWFAILGIGLVAIPREGQWLPLMIVSAAAWRIVEIVTYQMSVVLIETLQDNFKLKSLQRTMVLAVVNLGELALAFAILHLHSAGMWSNSQVCAEWYEALMYSLGYMVTAGGGSFSPVGRAGHLLLIAQMASQIIYVLTVLPVLVSTLNSRISGMRTDATSSGAPAQNPERRTTPSTPL